MNSEQNTKNNSIGLGFDILHWINKYKFSSWLIFDISKKNNSSFYSLYLSLNYCIFHDITLRKRKRKTKWIYLDKWKIFVWWPVIFIVTWLYQIANMYLTLIELIYWTQMTSADIGKDKNIDQLTFQQRQIIYIDRERYKSLDAFPCLDLFPK